MKRKDDNLFHCIQVVSYRMRTIGKKVLIFCLNWAHLTNNQPTLQSMWQSSSSTYTHTDHHQSNKRLIAKKSANQGRSLFCIIEQENGRSYDIRSIIIIISSVVGLTRGITHQCSLGQPDNCRQGPKHGWLGFKGAFGRLEKMALIPLLAHKQGVQGRYCSATVGYVVNWGFAR